MIDYEKSIEKDISFRSVLSVLLVSSLVFSILYFIFSSFAIDNFDNSLFNKAKALITLTENDIGKVELEFADEVMPEFNGDAGNPDYFQLWYSDGVVFEKSRSLKDESLTVPTARDIAPSFEDTTLIDGRSGRQISLTFTPHRDVEDDAVPTVLPDHHADIEMRLVVAQSRQSLDRALAQLRWSLGLAGFLLTVGLSLLLRHTVRRGMRPLQIMSSQIGRLDPAQLKARIEIESPPSELLPVINRLNELLGRLEKAFEKECRFSADVAHELRTPLAELQALADVAPRIATDRSAIARFMKDVGDIGRQMNVIVDMLINLARWDRDQPDVHVTTFSLRQAVLDVQRLVAEEPSRQIGFDLALSDGLMVMADEEKFRLILRNLLDNAHQYAPPGTSIGCRSFLNDAGKTTLIISNMAPELEPADLELMFDRFWRKDTARTSSKHAGLGLSLVKALAQALNIEVETDLQAGRFEVRLNGLTVDQSASEQIEGRRAAG